MRTETVTGPSPGSRPRILVIEKRGSLRKLIRQVLRDAGCHVLSATEIHSGLSRLAKSNDPVDLVVADTAASDLFTGATPREDLAERIRELRPGCRVVFVSDDPSRVLPRPDRPWIRHLARPFNLDELIQCVDEALSDVVPGRARGPGPGSRPPRSTERKDDSSRSPEAQWTLEGT